MMKFNWKGSIARLFRPQSVQCGTRANREQMTSQDLSKESEGARLNEKEQWI